MSKPRVSETFGLKDPSKTLAETRIKLHEYKDAVARGVEGASEKYNSTLLKLMQLEEMVKTRNESKATLSPTNSQNTPPNKLRGGEDIASMREFQKFQESQRKPDTKKKTPVGSKESSPETYKSLIVKRK